MITYDTGDSYHHESGVKSYLEGIEWKDSKKAEKALRDIEAHYHYYMILNKEWNVDQKDKDKAIAKAKRSKWSTYDTWVSKCKDAKIFPSTSALLVENDKGERVEVRVFWTGYFESLVGGDIVEENDKRSFRI